MAIARGGLLMRGNRPIEIFLILRMIIAALVVGAGIMIMQLTREDFPVKPLYILLALSYAVGGMLFLSLRLGLSPRLGLWSIMVADIVLETGILHYSGGVWSQFSLMFCLTIIAAAFLLQIPGGVGTAFLASGIYVLYGVFERYGVISPPSGTMLSAGVSPGIVQGYMHVSIFLLVGAVGGYLAGKMQLEGKLLERVETKLKQLRIDTDHILNNMSSGVLVVDSSGKIVTINPAAAEILGLKKSEVLTRGLSEVFEDAMPGLSFELAYALKAEKNKFRHEIDVINTEKKSIPLGISISILKDDGGQKRGVIAVFQDLTEVREMQERVRKADRLAAIGELAAGIAHELRNPLASISGSIEMLYNELELQGENKRLMELIFKESDRLDRIINDFLEFARLRPPDLCAAPLGRTIEDVLILLSNNLSVKKAIEIEVENRTKDGVVKIDEEQIKQVFLNMAVNACEAMKGKGRLSIILEERGDGWVSASFLDEGPGIGDEHKGRLFEPFFTTKDGGTGLGLAIANKIVEAHGGRIIFKNREQGGAEFSVLLPLWREKHRMREDEDAAIAQGTSRSVDQGEL